MKLQEQDEADPLEVLRGAILTQLLTVQNRPQLESLGGVAREALSEVVRSGVAGGEEFWPPVLKGLSVSPVSTLTTADSSTELTLCRANIYLDLLQILLTIKPEERNAFAPQNPPLPDAILACSSFCIPDSDTSETPVWTNKELARKSRDVLVITGAGVKTPLPQPGGENQAASTLDRPPSRSGTELIHTVLLKHLDSLLSRIHPILKTKADGSDESSFQVSKEQPLGVAILAAHQLSFLVRSIPFPKLGPVISRVMPCVLTCIDHWSPPVKKRGLKAIAHIVENVTVAELGWFGEVTMDALCKSAVGCDEEIWPVVLPALVKATTRIGGKDPRNKWYSHVLSLLLRDMELHYTDTPRRIVWLRETPPLVNSLGLFVVAHFKRLMPLLLTWLRTPDAETQLRTLDLLKLVILNTWPRMPAHAERLTSELRQATEQVEPGHDRTEAQEKIDEACQLLQRCKEHLRGGSAIESH